MLVPGSAKSEETPISTRAEEGVEAGIPGAAYGMADKSGTCQPYGPYIGQRPPKSDLAAKQNVFFWQGRCGLGPGAVNPVKARRKEAGLAARSDEESALATSTITTKSPHYQADRSFSVLPRNSTGRTRAN